MQVKILPLVGDNYIYLIHDGKEAVVVDPTSATPVLVALEAGKLQLRNILLTHHHGDHTAGSAMLKRRTGARIVGPADSRILGLGSHVHDGDTISACGSEIKVLHTPGHTRSHVAYYVAASGCVFTGDTVFVSGCGRIVEGTAKDMWRSVRTIRNLPPGTKMYCGHEYTEENLEFSLHLEPGNARMREKLAHVRAQLSRGEPTVPSSIAEERELNLFMRADTTAVQKAVDLEGAPASEVFAVLRGMKDRW